MIRFWNKYIFTCLANTKLALESNKLSIDESRASLLVNFLKNAQEKDGKINKELTSWHDMGDSSVPVCYLCIWQKNQISNYYDSENH